MSNTPTSNQTNQAAETDQSQDTLDTDVMQWLSAIVALVGLYLVASPFIFEATETAIWNDRLVGTAIFLLGGYNFYRLSKDQLGRSSIASLAALLGLWALISPYVIEMGSTELARSTVISGLIIAVLSAYSAYANDEADMPEPPLSAS
ncbi:SPW repeat protein [Halalkalicoccus ordinarius]|uniref:SPW repeat protein n=1 Tax=Halalkalicoccus ordinarius TaxID=3116651 RepID=UPI00300F46E6